MSSRFLFNEAVWSELRDRVPEAKRVRAAVAYLGSGSSHLLPLRAGDKLVVDMSLRAVRAGATDPKEVRKHLRNGVEVYSREALHAKFFVIDKTVIAGSSNISNHSHDRLDEAAILTNDVAAVRRAAQVFAELCTEPVRKEYLAKCLKEYRPPEFQGGPKAGRTKSQRLVQSKLWIVGGLRCRDLPEPEQGDAARVAKKFERRVLDYERCEVDYLHYPSRLQFFDSLREGDWLITCLRDGKKWDVWPPVRFLGLDRYTRGRGKQRHLLLYELPDRVASISWSAFRRAAASNGVSLPAMPRTKPLTSDAQADAILRLWDSRGRFRTRTKKVHGA